MIYSIGHFREVVPMKTLRIFTAVALTSAALLSAPSQAEKINAGSPPASAPAVNRPKTIEQPTPGGSTLNPSGGGQSGGIKSAPFNPVTVTFPRTTSRSQPSKIGTTRSTRATRSNESKR